MTTGLHAIHVIVGVIFLAVALVRIVRDSIIWDLSLQSFIGISWMVGGFLALLLVVQLMGPLIYLAFVVVDIEDY